MSAKEIVENFYKSAGILSKSYCLEILHEDVILEWYSSKGLLTLDLNDILALSKDLKHSYFSLTTQIDQVLAEEDTVTIRYSFYVRTFENPEEELILAVFFTVWEVKDGKLYKGYQMSQLLN